MAPPNRGVSKAVLPPARQQTLSRSIPTPVPTLVGPNSNNNNIVAPHINNHQSINAGTSSRSSITIPYPCASAGSLESRTNIQLQRDPSLSYIAGFEPYDHSPSSLSPDSTQYFAHTTTPAAVFPELSTFNSPISPSQLYSAESQSDSLGSLYHSSQSLDESSMFTDSNSSPHGPNSATYSSPHSSQEPNYSFADHPFSSSTTHSPYTTNATNSAFMYNPTETAARYSAASSSLSSSDDMETDTNNATTGSGQYLYNFSDVISAAPSPQGQDDDPDYAPSGAQLRSPSSPFAKTPASSKEKEQNKQKLYRNRKSEFTNRMRDELLEMNLLPHSRITHAPEIMSKTADTLRDYRELLLLIRDQVDGMPENLASVPGAIRKLLNENGQVFNNVKPPSVQHGPSRSMKGSSTGDYKPPLLHVTPIQPLPFRATGGGARHGTY